MQCISVKGHIHRSVKVRFRPEYNQGFVNPLNYFIILPSSGYGWTDMYAFSECVLLVIIVPYLIFDRRETEDVRDKLFSGFSRKQLQKQFWKLWAVKITWSRILSSCHRRDFKSALIWRLTRLRLLGYLNWDIVRYEKLQNRRAFLQLQ